MPSVFINYRVKDNPTAAAVIHDHLAQVFGKDEVFRDCVSMEGGEHYPSTIRAALARARVLIAVIGAQWLTLTDNGVRLIDREHDWVRLEIADAFRRGITVLPVLLKDVPENVVLPQADQLPTDVRPLAHIQAFEFSQRHLRRDLDRLAEVLIHK
ncbi:MAG TPA: TIR domain-containing protein, partial [Pseudonocardiaceae bacterium]|nr:TIR domain-containing protein [Pseudonocardiaceae bacterium]